MKAFDTYVELVTNANRRAEQSGKQLPNPEDQGTFIHTLSEGITLLCCYGSRKEAEKANQLAGQLDEILSALVEPEDSASRSDGDTTPSRVYRSNRGTDVPVSIISAGYRAVGIALANWARWTPVNESRRAIQDSAATAFEKALEAGPDLGSNVPTRFALGLLLAEIRDVDSAIEHARSALLQTSETDELATNLHAHSSRHSPLSVWHLLVLLLSARQEFGLAEKICNTATTDVSIQRALRSPSLYDGNDAGRSTALSMGGYNMEFRQKESLIELRMTQLAITEVLHGPEAALNRSDELFSLFATVFRGLGAAEKEDNQKSERLAPRKPSSTKTRSIRGTIFSRKRQPHGVDGEG